jgi:hypothetical protein
VLIRGLNDFALAEESPSKTWSRFFPGIERSKQDSFIYPPPYTVEFCYLYGERLSDFCNAAKLLVGAMSILGQQPTKMKRDPLACQQAFDTINLLRRPVASVLALEESAVNHRRVAPSLLASFADMFAQDLVYRLAIRQCGCCGTLFVSSAYQAKYCKESCRLRDQKRRLRAQMKQAKDLRAKGQSLKKIAGSVGHPPKRVKRWLANA